jgi:hypothetical protein
MHMKCGSWVLIILLVATAVAAQDRKKLEFEAAIATQADALERERLAEALIQSRESPENPLDPRLRWHLLRALSRETVSQLALRRETGHLGIEVSALGANTSDLVYTTFPQPCRVIDTRLIPGGKLPPDQERVYKITGNDSLAFQGGNPAGCGVPIDATVVNINFVAVAPEAAGNLRGAAHLSPIPASASILNYQLLNPPLNIANGVLFPMCDFWSNPFDCLADIKLQASGGSTHVVADVLGYARRFPEEEVKGFVVERWNNGTTTLSNTCANYADAAGILTIYAPVPGKVWVQGTVQMRAAHLAPCGDGTGASSGVFLSRRTGGAPQCSDFDYVWHLDLKELKCGTSYVNVPVDGVFTVTPSTPLGLTIDGRETPNTGDVTQFWYSELTARFIPD